MFPRNYKMLSLRILSTYQTINFKIVILNPCHPHTILGVNKDSCSREISFLVKHLVTFYFLWVNLH